MRKAVLIGTLTCLTVTAGAQTWSEWFRQKKTQIKYLVEQIAALDVYRRYVEKGYTIAKDGLQTIGGIKDDDFSVHKDYLASLQRVNPALKTYWKVAGAASLQTKIMAVYRQKKAEFRRSKQFTPDEIAFTDKVFIALLTDCNSLLEHLRLLTTDGASEMKDDERLKAINRIYVDMQDDYVFIQAFGAENSVLSVQRLRQEATVKTSRSFLNIH